MLLSSKGKEGSKDFLLLLTTYMNKKQKAQIALAVLFAVLFLVWLTRLRWDFPKILNLIGYSLGILSMVLSYRAEEKNKKKLD